jgi:cysteine synthase
MAEPFSVERRKLMRMLGAKVIVTPKANKGTGMIRKVNVSKYVTSLLNARDL